MLIQIEPPDVLVGVCEDFVSSEEFGLVVACVERVLELARVGEELAPVNAEGSEHEGAVGFFAVFAMLELHESLRTFGADGVADGAVVGFFVEAVVGEGVGDSGEGGLDELLVDGIIEALRSCYQRLDQR